MFLKHPRWAIAKDSKSLLEQDAVWVHQTSVDGWAPLHLAAAFGGPKATALLLEHGAHVHRFSRNPMRNQPLHACIALSGDQETVRLLIDQGADLNAAQAGGYTPLHQAAAAGRLRAGPVAARGRRRSRQALRPGQEAARLCPGARP